MNERRAAVGIIEAVENPFPGMNPYLENHWGDVHTSLVVYARNQIQSRLPEGLRARAKEIVAPAVARISDERATERFIEILDIEAGDRIATVIEFLTVDNKQPGEGQRLYRRRQKDHLIAPVNLVEIDLLRRGERVFAVPEALLPPSGRAPYGVCVRRASRPGMVEFYPGRLRERLPAIRIPLRETDQDVALDLQSLVNDAYRDGGYDDLNYRQEPDPPLETDDAKWADELLRSRGLR